MTASPRASLALSIDPDNLLALHGLSLIERLAARPPGAPAQRLVARGVQHCLQAAIETLGPTGSRPAEMLETICGLVTELEIQMENTGEVESLQAVYGLKSRYPGWSALCTAGAADHALAHTFLGLKVLKALHEEQPLGPTGSSRFHALLDEPHLTKEQVHSLLTDAPGTEEEDQGWVTDLRRTYRQVLRAYLQGTMPPPGNGRSRVTGQLLDGVLAATAARRAGASNHRELSPGQMSLALAHIEQGLARDTFNGCLGVLVAISGFTSDLLLATPLAKPASHTAADLYLDLEQGMLCIDHSGLVREAATAQPGSGCIPASQICEKPLPIQLHRNLLKRQAQFPDATTLADLYPGVPCPASADGVYPSQDMIYPSWARFRNSLGSYLRNQGLDSLLASVISGRFWHIPKSKLYYMALPRKELQTGGNRHSATCCHLQQGRFGSHAGASRLTGLAPVPGPPQDQSHAPIRQVRIESPYFLAGATGDRTHALHGQAFGPIAPERSQQLLRVDIQSWLSIRHGCPPRLRHQPRPSGPCTPPCPSPPVH